MSVSVWTCSTEVVATKTHDKSQTQLVSKQKNVSANSLAHSLCQLGYVIDKKMLSTINKILIDKISTRSFCYQPTVDKDFFLSTNCWYPSVCNW
jgi:hypothetical protein